MNAETKKRLLRLSKKDRLLARAAVALVQAVQAVKPGGTTINWGEKELADFASDYAIEFIEHFESLAADDWDGIRAAVRSKLQIHD